MPNAPFSWPVRVYYEDTDAQGVVYYANYFKFMERARTEWIRAMGIDQDELLREKRRMFVVANVEARFVKPARFGDSLDVTAALSDRARASFLIAQDIRRDGADGELLCAASVRAAYIDADTLKPTKLPDLLLRDTAYEH